MNELMMVLNYYYFQMCAYRYDWYYLHYLPANICWSWRRLQRNNSTSSVTSWRRLAMTFWRRLEGVLKTSWKTKNYYAEDVLKTSWRHVLKTSWRHVLKKSWRHVLKMSWRHTLKTSWRHRGDKQNAYWGYLYLTNLNVYLTNLYFTNLYLTILMRIQNAFIN